MTIDVSQIRAAVQGAGATWHAGPTLLSQLTSEQRKLRLGVQPPPQEASIHEIDDRARRRSALVAAVERRAGVPTAYDLRKVDGKNFVTPVRDQGGCGSSVAFGVIGSIEGTLRVQRNDPTLDVDLSEAHLFYCLGKAYGITCASGWWPDHALELCARTGVTDEACFPYAAGDQDCSRRCADWASRVTKITRHRALTAPVAMKEWIATRGPLTTCFIVYDDFFTYTSGIYRHVTGALAGGHCVVIVGYDDVAGCWICKNSWGTAWGEGGYFRIGYGDCGIDSWSVSAVDGIEETGWLNDRRVIGFWSNDQERNAWVFIDGGVGWRRLAFGSDAIHSRLLTLLIAARSAGRSVHLLQTQSVITQVYLL